MGRLTFLQRCLHSLSGRHTSLLWRPPKVKICAKSLLAFHSERAPRIAGQLSNPRVRFMRSLAALVACAAPNVRHEAVGHGGACLALGGKPLVLLSAHFECGEQGMSALAICAVAAAGTIVNFIIGALALVVFKTANPLHKPYAAYFLWLFTTLNLLSGVGYFFFSGISGIGDWADVARGTIPPFVWRPAMSVFGGTLYFLLARQSAQWLRSLVGSGELSLRRSKLRTPDLGGSIMIPSGKRASGQCRGKASRWR
jgi:hypothetical protein